MRYSSFKFYYNRQNFVREDDKKMKLKDFIEKHDQYRGGNLNTVWEFFDDVLADEQCY